MIFFQDDIETSSLNGAPQNSSDDFNLSMTFEQVQERQFKAYELLALRRHYSTEVRNLANMLGNSLEKIDFIELDDFLGIDETKAFKLSLVRVKNLKYGDALPEIDSKA